MTEPVGTLDFGWSGSTRVARLAAEIDLSNAPGFEREILAELAKAPSLVVDLSSVSYFDSSGVRLLFNVARAAEASGRRIAIVAPEGRARMVLRICAFREDLIVDTLEEALGGTDPDDARRRQT